MTIVLDFTEIPDGPNTRQHWAPKAKAMSERELQSAVNEMLTANGWRWTHFRTAQLPKGDYATALDGNKGFPDVVAVRNGRLLFAELKAHRGKPSSEQEEWLWDLWGCGSEVDSESPWTSQPGEVPETYVWKPSDLLDGTIARTLA